MMLVSSYNEWDPLEEVIVGSVQGAAKMGFEPSVNAYYLKDDTFRQFKGTPHSQEAIEKAETQLNQLAAILTAEGVVVKRPDPLNHAIPIKTMDFEVQVGNCSACPRDVLLVIGEEIIEAPMAQRARFFEYSAYRSLVKDYFLYGQNGQQHPSH